MRHNAEYVNSFSKVAWLFEGDDNNLEDKV
jgi:hypothetical protein